MATLLIAIPTGNGRWTLRKHFDGRWMVRSPEGIKAGFRRWRVAVRFAVLMAYDLPVMSHGFEADPDDAVRCLVCEEHEECHRGAN